MLFLLKISVLLVLFIVSSDFSILAELFVAHILCFYEKKGKGKGLLPIESIHNLEKCFFLFVCFKSAREMQQRSD